MTQPTFTAKISKKNNIKINIHNIKHLPWHFQPSWSNLSSLTKGSEWVSEWQGKTVIRKSPMKKGQCCRRFLYLWRRRRKFIFFVSFFVRVRQEYLNFCRLWQYPSCVKLTQSEKIEYLLFYVLMEELYKGKHMGRIWSRNLEKTHSFPARFLN